MTAFITLIGDADLGAGRLEAAVAQYRKSLDAGDHTFFNYANLAAAYALLGKMDEAKPFVAETLRVNPSFTVKWFQNHTAYVIPKRDEVFARRGLRRSSELQGSLPKAGAMLVACRLAGRSTPSPAWPSGRFWRSAALAAACWDSAPCRRSISPTPSTPRLWR
jgi:tetratricopeptide (TPR) repeat protein